MAQTGLRPYFELDAAKPLFQRLSPNKVSTYNENFYNNNNNNNNFNNNNFHNGNNTKNFGNTGKSNDNSGSSNFENINLHNSNINNRNNFISGRDNSQINNRSNNSIYNNNNNSNGQYESRGGEDNLGLRYLAALSLAPGTKPPISFNQLLRVETNLAGMNKQQFSSSSSGVSNQQLLLQSISSSSRPPVSPVSPTNGQSSSSPHSPSSVSTERNSKYKSALCQNFEKFGSCGYQDNCEFAHGRQELRLSGPNNRKTKRCNKYWSATGFCLYGIRCDYIHSEKEEQRKEETEAKQQQQPRGSESSSSQGRTTGKSPNGYYKPGSIMGTPIAPIISKATTLTGSSIATNLAVDFTPAHPEISTSPSKKLGSGRMMHFVYENRVIWIDSLVGVVTNNFSIQLKAENDNNNNNNKSNNKNSGNKNEEHPSTQGGVEVFDQKDPMVFEELAKQAEMVLKGPIDPIVKTTNLYSTVTVGTA